MARPASYETSARRWILSSENTTFLRYVKYNANKNAYNVTFVFDGVEVWPDILFSIRRELRLGRLLSIDRRERDREGGGGGRRKESREVALLLSVRPFGLKGRRTTKRAQDAAGDKGKDNIHRRQH